LPDEVLEEVALVLGEQQDLGLLNDALQVAKKALALTRQLLGWRVERPVCECGVERDIDLLVGRDLSFRECCVDG
jgi:hypothetical protein